MKPARPARPQRPATGGAAALTAVLDLHWTDGGYTGPGAGCHSALAVCQKPRSCWASQVAPVLARVPVIAGEIGERGCRGTYIEDVAAWLDSRSSGYLAWSWDVTRRSCAGGSGLIRSYDGTPTPRGAAYRALLRSLADSA